MSAGMHHAGIFRNIRNFVVFPDWQCIHISPEGDHLVSWFTAMYKPDDSMSGDTCLVLNPPNGKLL
jgi:hypothetical protein